MKFLAIFCNLPNLLAVDFLVQLSRSILYIFKQIIHTLAYISIYMQMPPLQARSLRTFPQFSVRIYAQSISRLVQSPKFTYDLSVSHLFYCHLPLLVLGMIS